jgi:hypothetical protein
MAVYPPLEQETLEKVKPVDARDKAGLESKIDQAKPAADKPGAASEKTATDAEQIKAELPDKQYDAKSEAGARIESADTKLRFGSLEANRSYERNGYHYKTDNQGRVETVSGKLTSQKGIRDNYEQQRVGHLGQEGDHGGHLIATCFDGSPEGVNLVPQDSNLNQGEWKRMEGKWAKVLKNGQDVQVDIKAHYPDKDSVRPDSFAVKYKIGDEKAVNQFFKNQPGG